MIIRIFPNDFSSGYGKKSGYHVRQKSGILRITEDKFGFAGGQMMSKLQADEYKLFEDIKKIRKDGSEYWLARELAPVLDYVQWRNFTKVMDRAMIACKNSGYVVSDHFAEVSKMVDIGSDSKRPLMPDE